MRHGWSHGYGPLLEGEGEDLFGSVAGHLLDGRGEAEEGEGGKRPVDEGNALRPIVAGEVVDHQEAGEVDAVGGETAAGVGALGEAPHPSLPKGSLVTVGKGGGVPPPPVFGEGALTVGGHPLNPPAGHEGGVHRCDRRTEEGEVPGNPHPAGEVEVVGELVGIDTFQPILGPPPEKAIIRAGYVEVDRRWEVDVVAIGPGGVADQDDRDRSGWAVLQKGGEGEEDLIGVGGELGCLFGVLFCEDDAGMARPNLLPAGARGTEAGEGDEEQEEEQGRTTLHHLSVMRPPSCVKLRRWGKATPRGRPPSPSGCR